MKKIGILLVLTVAVMLFSQIGVFAATPEVMMSVETEEANTSELVSITKPENLNDTTFNVSYIVSGYGIGGTTVTFYRYNAEEDLYEKVYNEMKYIDENGASQKIQSQAEVTIGTSGLFLNSISLGQGENTILVRAENGDLIQYIELYITKYSYNIIDLIKSMAA